MVPEAVAVVAGFQDVTAVREPVEQGSGHLGVITIVATVMQISPTLRAGAGDYDKSV